eukprot:COSAG05_NODE_20088_length_283_cov_0.847826_1_plen_71_part_10
MEESTSVPQPAGESLYAILGIAADATAGVIKKAYYQLARKCHPDKNPGNEETATEHFKKIKRAYDILSDPQ